MSENVYLKIIKFLDERKVYYQVFEHEPVFTSEQAAEVRGTDIKQGAKALVFVADKKPIMLVISGDKKVDMKKFKQTYGIKNLAFATPDEVGKFTEGVKIGAVHPLGVIHRLPVYVDGSLGTNKEIVFNAGLHHKSIKMYYRDYYKLVKPILGNFSK